MRLRWISSVIFVTVLASLFAGFGVRESLAQGVSVAPLRLLFDARTRSATVFLSNRSPETATYRIALVNRRMLEDGSIVPAEVAQPGEYFADDLIRFSPRRVTIAPFGSQTIRLLVRRPRGDFPEDVEFRTHLAIRSIPPTPLLQDLENLERLTNEGQLSVKAVATIETVMPLVLRLGNPQATIQIANPVLDLNSPESTYPILKVELIRGGARSVYGELEILHIAPGGQETQIHLAKGLAVYSPTERRKMKIALKMATAEMLVSGKLLVRFTESEEMKGDQSAQLLINLGEGQVQVQ
jgi:P pilus assembly chaperone PapD